MPEANPNAFIAATNDLRHTYEQVFYGRQITDDWRAPEAAAPDTAAAATPEVAAADATASGPAPNGSFGGVWGDVQPPAPETGGIHGAPQIEAPTIDGSATPIAGQIAAPAVEAPAIEPPASAPAGNDMTPG